MILVSAGLCNRHKSTNNVFKNVAFIVDLEKDSFRQNDINLIRKYLVISAKGIFRKGAPCHLGRYSIKRTNLPMTAKCLGGRCIVSFRNVFHLEKRNLLPRFTKYCSGHSF